MLQDLVCCPRWLGMCWLSFMSTVSSESTFSTSGQVLDVFRSSLSPKTTEALICTQNWLKPMKLDFQDFEFADDIDDYEEIEKGQFNYL